ncbi:MAG: 2-amino-4-hydroxy-6-hydroxymethyldihydropteridine diphosphokinase [Treponema sp.]|jgi:2-amino-4-hydroxy-6-hydroxymethyldihydropteridine diphosphokinase|nr:2-amino-4-hydroxy-6-hydroxymethyldihydropteridine diphosphokinase [Treponema sp.]
MGGDFLMTMTASLVVLGLGSNKGDSPRILEGAIEALGEVLMDLRRASLFETEPLHVLDQKRFLNTAVAGYYSLSPRDLLEIIHRLEASLGRDRTQERRWGERTLDIDILLFGNLLIAEPPDLEIPHPRLAERAFALAPLLELVPGAIDPRTGVSYQTIFAKLPPQGIYSL